MLKRSIPLLAAVRSSASLPSNSLTLHNLLSSPNLHLQTLLQIHALILTSGNSTNPFFTSKLVSLYASSRRPDLSSLLFSTFPSELHDAFLWNSIVKVRFSNSDFNAALRLYRLMRASAFPPDHFTAPMVVSACAELLWVCFGSCIHGDCVKFGLLSGDFVAVGSSLMYMYCKFGLLCDALKVFDEMPLRDVVSWTALIVGCVRNGEFGLGLSCFREMLCVGERVNSRTVDGVLQACAGLAALQEGRCVHGFCFKIGIELSFVNMYSKCDSLEDVVLAFEELAEKDVVSYTAVVGAYARKGLSAECLELFRDMMVSGLEPDGVFISCMLTGFVNSGSIADGKAFHGVILKRNFLIDTLAGNSLISMYCKFEQLGIAEKIFYNMFERDTESWNLLICGYGKMGSYVKCLDLFREMYFRGLGAVADCNILVPVISSCSQLGALSLGQSVHCYKLKNILPNDATSVHNALVGMYGRCGRLDLARSIFYGMSRDVVTWNTLIATYAHLGYSNEALSLFDQMLAEGIKPTSAALMSALSACSNIAALHCGTQMHIYIREMGLECDVSVCTALVDMYAKCGQIKTSREIFDSMPVKDIVAWNVMISAYGIHGYANEALEIFKEAERSGLKPNGVTFLAVLSACSHGGMIEEGKNIFARMSDYGIAPTVKHYACMVDILGRSGNLSAAEAMVLSMPIKPDGGIWGALLSACRALNNVDMGEHAARMALESDPENEGYYTSLSNMYGSAGRWEEVGRIRGLMKDRGVRKRAGWSALELDGRVLIFTVGDISHPYSESMPLLLENLCRQMEASCYNIENELSFIISSDIY
ncbi:TPR-like protein [Dioscorea alata]|uniref:TPR-like protein n=1 Tax=Dioscorea alata TaxID=55571 RepID=A0ACB7W835_DIOAL|nr:TPR-like protein [Dioscorea alata]